MRTVYNFHAYTLRFRCLPRPWRARAWRARRLKKGRHWQRRRTLISYLKISLHRDYLNLSSQGSEYKVPVDRPWVCPVLRLLTAAGAVPTSDRPFEQLSYSWSAVEACPLGSHVSRLHLVRAVVHILMGNG